MARGLRLEGQVAIITGSSRGIGRAVAELFAEEGAAVVIVSGSSLEAARAVAKGIEAKGGRALAVKADVADSREVKGMVERTLKAFGQIDVLVNNAGTFEPKRLLEIDEVQWDRTMAVHLKGSFLCTKAVVPHMMSRGRGRIINVAAPSALRGSKGYSDYASAKGGIISFTKALAKELGPHGINVNCVIPVAETGMSERLRAFLGGMEVSQRYPLGRRAKPEEIAPVFLFFASKDSEFVTGQVLAVDGGLTI